MHWKACMHGPFQGTSNEFFLDVVPENGTDFGNAMCHVAFDKSARLNIGLHNYGETIMK